MSLSSTLVPIQRGLFIHKDGFGMKWYKKFDMLLKKPNQIPRY